MLSNRAIHPQKMTIAMVDDDPIIQQTLSAYFEGAGFNVCTAGTGGALRHLMDRRSIDLMLMDIRLPDCDGLSLMREIRARSDVPVILVTSRGEEADRVVGLEMGADDYVTKPFSSRELLARVNSVLRRSSNEPAEQASGVRRFAGWTLDLDGHKLTADNGETSRLTHGEFSLLEALTRYPGRIMTRDDLISSETQREWNPNDRTIDVLISRLRRKIEPDPSKPTIIVTEYGLGYVFAERVS